MEGSLPRAMVLAALALGTGWGCTATHRPSAASPVVASSTRADAVRHPVEPGQTLWRIARVYGIPMSELAEANGIVDSAQVKAGLILLVPGATRILEVPPYPAPLPPRPDIQPTALPPGVSTEFIWPLNGVGILSRFGEARGRRRHRGLDLQGVHGQRVLASAPGHVSYSGSTLRGYGKTVIVDHRGGFQSLYAHNSRLFVRVGDLVDRGETIALVGRTGNATNDHCHFEIRKDRVPVDPLP